MNVTPDIMRQVAVEAVKQAFKEMGMDAQSPIEMQKDMAFLRTQRVRCENVANKVLAWAVIAVVSTGSLLSLSGIRDWLKQ
jgi:hypothetical protein